MDSEEVVDEIYGEEPRFDSEDEDESPYDDDGRWRGGGFMKLDSAKAEWERSHPPTDNQRMCREICGENHRGLHEPNCPIILQASRRQAEKGGEQ